MFESLLTSSQAPADRYSDPTVEPIEFVPDLEERELETTDQPSSVGRSLIRSLGGLVWVIVLIGFTLARNCGGSE